LTDAIFPFDYKNIEQTKGFFDEVTDF